MPRPKKHLGQHFLTQAGVIHRLLDGLDLYPGDHVVEIGPGQGALTQWIQHRCARLDAIEFDSDMVTALARLGLSEHVHVHQADALQFDFHALHPDGLMRLVGNLPYNISVPLLLRFYRVLPLWKDIQIMVQWEVAERLWAQVGTRHYSRMSVLTQVLCDPTCLLAVAPEAFTPPPAVESAVVRLTPHASPELAPDEMASFSAWLQVPFQQRRKTLSNNLKGQVSRDELLAWGFDPGLRPQELPGSEFVRLWRALGRGRASGRASGRL